MSRTKLINGVRKPLSPEEEAERDAEEAAWIAGAEDRAAEQAQQEALQEATQVAPGGVRSITVAQRTILAALGPQLDYAIKHRLGKAVVVSIIDSSELTATNKTKLKAWLRKATE